MSGNTNYPTGLDDDASLLEVTDGVTPIIASQHNNLKEAIKAIERRLGINSSGSPTSIDYILGNPTDGHRHDGVEGQGPVINPTTIPVPSGGFPSGGNLAAHLMDANLHNPSAIIRHMLSVELRGSIPSGVNRGAPLSVGRTMQLENIRANLRVGPTAATMVANVKFGATGLWQASVGNRIMFAPNGATDFGHASPNLITYPSGAIITTDIDIAASPDQSADLSLVLVFRE